MDPYPLSCVKEDFTLRAHQVHPLGLQLQAEVITKAQRSYTAFFHASLAKLLLLPLLMLFPKALIERKSKLEKVNVQ